MGIIPDPEIGPDVWFVPRKKGFAPDLARKVIDSSFANFSFPTKEEGFDKIKYEWKSEADSSEYLKQYQLAKKATSIVQDLKPSDWFKEKVKAFTDSRKEWKKK